MVGRCALYRHFDAEGTLLYVGISLRPFTRTNEHMRISGWADTITNVTIQYFPTRKEAMEAESAAVKAENPLHNIRLRKPKQVPRAAAVTERRAEEARIDITRRVINYAPLYKLSEATDVLGIPRVVLNREIADGNIAVTMIPSTKPGKMNAYLTGWQIIDWLESRERDVRGASSSA